MAKGLRKLHVEKCTLVGLSYGGIVGFKMAEMFPNLVDSMALYFDQKKERHELLGASTVKDKDFTVPSFTQRIYLLWGGDDIIFDKEEVRNLKEYVLLDIVFIQE
ncbi:hypothetical protein POTOM_034753 [Populus tomentosa]|uniref:Uncharacterized protein n=1 Tax=Populus tomentosa TaxID=118781 RepID=A0A8X8CPL7_POPTO|nr:hypothetical protein POTOM_034753 [Populus tomentosa]